MSRYKNLVGQRFGHLTVVGRSERRNQGNRAYHWLCKCDCGRYLLCRTDNLKSGHTTQCSICSNNRGNGAVFVGSDGLDDQI